MLTLRKIDLIGQAVLVAIILMLTIGDPILAAAGFFVLGVWQVLSALVNTSGMVASPFRKKIIAYWIITALDLSLALLRNDYGYYALMIIAGGIAIYYWIIYRLFIKYLTHREELATIVR